MNKSSLKSLAGSIWLIMGGVLLFRGALMVKGVWSLDPEYVGGIDEPASHTALIIYILIGLVVGGAKGKFVLSKSAKRNCERIDRLDDPVKFYQVFPLKLIPLIGVMIGMGLGIRYLAAHNDAAWNSWITWAGCGAVYVGIGAALAASSLAYFKKKLESA